MDITGLDTDLILTIGLVVAVFAIPAVISAFSDHRPPRAATLAVLVSGGLIVFAFYANPGGYTIERIPDAVARTVARLLN
jgi:hypothetical protein